ncbi:hypothetical protein, partial [Nocardia farcinica]|uniref:hypothetical protein n=1 Tax=Nocardia farcinica TaxID=37329 RepID=UPI001E59CADE
MFDHHHAVRLVELRLARQVGSLSGAAREPPAGCLSSNDQNLWIPGGRAFPEDDRRSHRILIKTSVGALAGRHARAH